MGVEYQVPDVAAARSVCEAQGVRIINDLGRFFFTYPGNCLGISFELWDGNWRDPAPPNVPNHTDVHPVSYWRDEHPLGVTGLARISVAVEDLASALETFQTLTSAPLIGDVERPRAAATGAQLQVGDTVFELLAPTGDGAVADYLARYGERIRSTVFRVANLERVEQHLASQGFSLAAGDADDALAMPAVENKNLLFEFTE